MPTTFFLPSTTTTPVTPGYAAWTGTAQADRREMHTVKQNTAHASKTFGAGGAWAANSLYLNRQYVSKPLSTTANVTHAGSWTNVPAGAKADVFIKVVGVGAADPSFGLIVLQVK